MYYQLACSDQQILPTDLVREVGLEPTTAYAPELQSGVIPITLYSPILQLYYSRIDNIWRVDGENEPYLLDKHVLLLTYGPDSR